MKISEIVKQLRFCGYKDEHGHVLEMNVAFKALEALVEVDAKLAAAAPELLAALEALEKCHRGGYQMVDDAKLMAIRGKAKAAIKKARGE